MARRGRPVGSLNDRTWADALRKVGSELSAGRGSQRKLEMAARALVTAAAAGDITACRELGDRLDGKAPQQQRIAGHDGGPLDLSMMSEEHLEILASRLASGNEEDKPSAPVH